MHCSQNNKLENVDEKLLRQIPTVDKIGSDKDKTEIPRKTLTEKLKCLRSNITVEPIMAGMILPAALGKLATQNLNLAKACLVKLNYGPEICNPLIDKNGSNLIEYEREVQKVISSVETWRSIIHTALPTLVVMFMGAWSDRTGNRKICMLLPIFGDLLMTVSNIVSSILFYEIPVEVTMLLEVLFPAITGGYVTSFIGVFSYISDISTPETRTFRIGMVNLCLTTGILIGTSLSGLLLKYCGYVGTFVISGCLYLMTMIYGYVCLKSNTNPAKVDIKKFKFSELLSLQKDTISVVTKKRQGDVKLMITLHLLVVAILFGAGHGEHIITYLFVRYRLNWDAVKYSMYSTYSHILHAVAVFLSISILSKRWGVDDPVLCLISVTSKLMGFIYINFVRTDFQMYLGKMNSLFSLMEALSALVFDPLYATIYAQTVKQFTSAVYVFSAGMTVPPIIMLIWFIIRNRYKQKHRPVELENLPNESDLPA
ncbi:proton-coupled folate transporter-like [Leguminivora glycinivorella]|uniref:proton-coupled folate transporter-like n=1 Tax=Leguminivora glycinivorella TaxID=1035111 RepID=UPI00200EA4B6|nr:proton-coupled folate transporter-like [Leguminivora glycinivorella]